MTGFGHLMAPGRIGAMTVRNRVVMSPMETMYGTPDGLPSERTRDYFAARAKGGVGLITLGATGIDNQHPETPGGLHLATDEAVDAHRALVEVVHEHGAKIQPQIVHAGPDGLGPEIFGVTSLGPSVIPSYLTGRPSVEISKQQLCAVLDLFKAAARRAAEAGYDGIELHAAHGYMLLGSFLAPQRNRRTDDYRGDSARGRVRVVLEALAAIRSEIGDALPITLRISGYERVAGGRPIFETAQLAPEFVAAGVDAFHVSGGVIDRLVTGMVNGADDGDELNVGAAAAVKQVVDVPVIAVGRIHDPVRAERILADGRADFIAMGRPLLADPDLPRKLRAGQAHRIRRCISCENCIDAMEQRFSVDCAVNPAPARSANGRAPRRARQARGGDRRRAGRAGGRPGGRRTRPPRHAVRARARWAGRCGGRRFCIRRTSRSCATCATRSGSARESASGPICFGSDMSSRPGRGGGGHGGRVAVPAIPGSGFRTCTPGPDCANCWRSRGIGAPAWQRLGACWAAGGSGWCAPRGPAGHRAWMPVGRRVAIIGGDLVALELAEFLASRGRLVSILESGKNIAPEVGNKRKTEHMDRLDRLGVTVHVRATAEQDHHRGGGVHPRRRHHAGATADSVVLAGTVEPDTTLFDALVAAMPGAEVHAAGDCTGLGLIRKATEEGARAACAI